jgi:HTH-type transcriptional regulator / antitoxin HigA
MAKIIEFQPDWVSAPGDTVADVLEERNLSLSDFAKDIGHTREYAQDLLDGRATITASLARQLERVVGGTATFWMNRETQYRNGLAQIFRDDQDAPDSGWLTEIPFTDMVKFGWIPRISSSADKVAECLRFFGVSSSQAWRERYGDAVKMAAFRTSTTYASESGAVAAWLRQGEIEGNSITCRRWNATRFEETLPEIRELTRKKDPNLFLSELTELCADCGVAVVIVRAPKGCRASGATRFLTPEKAVLQLSFRYLSDDHFWFTFFHEAGHLLLHSQETLFLEGNEACSSKEEEEANAFANNILIPIEAQATLPTLGADAKKVMRFARDIGVSAGVVVGQLQHLGLIPRHYLNKLKTRFSWDKAPD